MLTITLNPNGRRRVVPIAEGLLYFGIDIHRFTDYPDLTQEERHQRARQRRRERRERRRWLQEQRGTER